MTHLPPTNKALGQHWLSDPDILSNIVDHAEINDDDIVLEIGPGAGTLTELLCKKAKKVIAVEFDTVLASTLPIKVKHSNLEVIQGDIRTFNFELLPKDYKIVANIPYYLTSHLLRILTETKNMPKTAVLLMQKEVARRICSQPGDLSVLAIVASLMYRPTLGVEVPAKFFTPPPKVDSQVLILKRLNVALSKDLDQKILLRIIKAGFSEKRKKLRSSLAGGLHLEKSMIDELLIKAGINPDARAQELSIQEWFLVYDAYRALH